MDAAMLHEYFEYSNGKLYWKKCKAAWVNRGKEAGSVNAVGYRTVVVHQKRYAVHRLIYWMLKGYAPNQIDHINGIKTDNRIENLREVSDSQNRLNTGLQKNNTSGVKGVSWNKRDNKWAIEVTVNKVRYRDSSNNLEEAKNKAIQLRKMYHGQYANHGI